MSSSSTSTVHLEVLPVVNKLRYEKSLIGQLFNNPEPNPAFPRIKSPLLVRKLTSSNTATPSPEPAASQTLQIKEEELQRARHTPIESNHQSNTPSPPASTSPTLRDHSESPALASVVHMVTKKAGKRMRIDLKKGKRDVKSQFC